MEEVISISHFFSACHTETWRHSVPEVALRRVRQSRIATRCFVFSIGSKGMDQPFIRSAIAVMGCYNHWNVDVSEACTRHVRVYEVKEDNRTTKT